MTRNMLLVGAGLASMLLGACAPPAVTPMNEAGRKAVVAVSPEITGAKHSNTSDLGARGSAEGANKGASQAAAAAMRSSTSLLGLLIVTPLAAAAGSAVGAAQAKSEVEVDGARSNLRIAIQQTDFMTMLREELGRTPGAGRRVVVVDATAPDGTPITNAAMVQPGLQPSHILTVDYQMGMVVTGMVVPDVQASVVVKTQVMTRDRRTVLHSGTWMYCGPKRNFIDASADDGAPLRADYRHAALVVAEAITYDTFVSQKPRYLSLPAGCMDLADLPSGNGRPITVSPPPSPSPPPTDPAVSR